jgi:DnaK suppressor protein
VAAHEQMLEQLAEVDRALEKLDDGTYGTCDRCGTDIPQGRLEVHPSATRCVACASG